MKLIKRITQGNRTLEHHNKKNMSKTTGITREEAKHCVGPGWHLLIDLFYDFCEAEKAKVHVSQVKEKLARLCLYHDNGTDRTLDVEVLLAILSEHVCENCGVRIDDPVDTGSWIYPLCEKCYGERKRK